jgi:hypothetical protein
MQQTTTYSNEAVLRRCWEELVAPGIENDGYF